MLLRLNPLFIVQTPKEVLFLYQSDHQVRHIYMNVPHSEHVAPSWYGESVGRYEGDTLVVDTVGITTKAAVDYYLTPHTDKLHVVERYRLLDDGRTLEDPGGDLHGRRPRGIHDALVGKPAVSEGRPDADGRGRVRGGRSLRADPGPATGALSHSERGGVRFLKWRRVSGWQRWNSGARCSRYN
jgi:hypothetical protein